MEVGVGVGATHWVDGSGWVGGWQGGWMGALEPCKGGALMPMHKVELGAHAQGCS